MTAARDERVHNNSALYPMKQVNATPACQPRRGKAAWCDFSYFTGMIGWSLVRCRLKNQCPGIDAIAQTRGRRAVGKHMSQMAAADRAQCFRADHEP